MLLPYPELKAFQSRSYGLVINDRNGAALRVIPAADGVKREWAYLEEIPQGAIKVFVRAEDRRFYFHPGIDPVSIIRSAMKNVQAGRVVSGASTITMQLARLVRPHSQGIKGKIAEAWDAIRLEAKLSKKEILELWLNGIPFGSNIEGLPAMTRSRFGHPVAALDDSRACLLAVVPRRPGLYDPAINPEAAAFAAFALSQNCNLGLSESSLMHAAAEAAIGSVSDQANQTNSDKTPFRAVHFTDRVAGLFPPGTAAYSVTSTLDFNLQRYAEEQLLSELASLQNNRVSNGAILAIENETGAVRVYAGSASWFDDAASGKIDGVKSRAQPGSCLKPFLYAMALDSDFSPAVILPDLPTVFGSAEAYVPANFNQRFNGPVRFRLALASSLNVPAVYLLERLGVSAFEDYLINLGFDSIAETRGSHGTGLALGNVEVSLEELVKGFSSFPRGGVPVELKWIEGGEHSPVGVNQGTANPKAAKPIMSAYAAWAIADILSDRSSRFIGFGPAPTLATPFASMFKTGTANQYQHIWALGATKRFTVGVWMGNFSGETVVGKTGSSIPARIVSHILAAMEQTGANSAGNSGEAPLGSVSSSGENLSGTAPGSVAEVRICALSGMLAGPYCTGLAQEWLERNKMPGVCTWHTASGLFYPPEYQSWLAERFRAGRVRQNGNGSIRMPVSGSVFYADPALPVDAQALRIEAAGFGSGAFVYLDGALQGSLNFAGVHALPLYKGKHTVIVEDENGAAASVDFEVR
ncbi:transglycosylase domain-containing protein [Leadbettera azotonutricia]|uniref:transglycosylase domain-containing protein n=1 Tax=Leadbettera azotonutricia TaxID=150829 RepID=UPI001FE10B8E|nr:transglycosylase domain-containing protein [Leadbettera azotonutricia]